MHTNKKYISCIKISGKPILPPLITLEIKKECMEFKKKAISVEKKVDRNKVFAKCLEDLVKLQKQTKILRENQITDTLTIDSLENQIATNEVNDYVDMLNDRTNKFKHLTTETIDVSEYIDDGVRVLSSDNISISNEDKSQSTPRPKLIRSNSYTLESPSPILLAHLEKEAAQVSSSLDQSLNLSPVTIVDNETPTQEIIETDVKIEQFSVTGPINSPIEKLDLIKNCDLESHLLETLKHLPENCIKNIIEIFENQRTNQSETLQQINDEVLRNCVETSDKPLSLSITSNQSVYYSIQSTTAPLDQDDENIVNLNNVRNSVDKLTENDLRKKERAASIIGAYARGYLVRRLIKTEKVQALIDTIKDALLCALQLHSAQVIDESDIELHRRLIQQVSAACYAFHDVFFLISVKEQMAIISLDRQRRIEKSRRPVSSGGSRVSTPGRSLSEKIKLTR